MSIPHELIVIEIIKGNEGNLFRYKENVLTYIKNLKYIDKV